MATFDSNWQPLGAPDMERGELQDKSVKLECVYIVTTPEQVEEYTVKEYPNGGRDIAYKVTTEEVGHWQFTREGESEPWEGCPYEVPADWNKAQAVEVNYNYQLYVPYSDEEFRQRQQKKEEQEQEEQEQREQQELINTLPDAVADLSEQVSSNADNDSTLIEAVAELSQLVSDLMEGMSE